MDLSPTFAKPRGGAAPDPGFDGIGTPGNPILEVGR
jgi:hypothetical protein